MTIISASDIDVMDMSVTSRDIVDTVDPTVWDRWAQCITQDPKWRTTVKADELSVEDVHRLANESAEDAISFLRLMRFDCSSFSPSVPVDRAWHLILERTRFYFKLCDLLVGSYIHHEPTDQPGVDYGQISSTGTLQALQALGLPAHAYLWERGTDRDDPEPCHGCCGKNPPPSPNAGKAVIGG